MFWMIPVVALVFSGVYVADPELRSPSSNFQVTQEVGTQPAIGDSAASDGSLSKTSGRSSLLDADGNPKSF